MGLDWNPGPKAKAGNEQEFEKLWKSIHSKWCFRRSAKIARFGEITDHAFNTLGAPAVGIHASADEWARRVFPERVDKSISWDQFYDQLRGFFVLDLVPPCDGIPRYSNGSPGGYVERFSFRAKFLEDCLDIIGEDLLKGAFQSKLPAPTVAYGTALLRRATEYATMKRIDVTMINRKEESNPLLVRLDVVFSAARWCRFWGERGHWLDAYY